MRVIRKRRLARCGLPSKPDVGNELFSLAVSAVARRGAWSSGEAAPRVADALEYRRQEHEVHELGIELRAASRFDDGGRGGRLSTVAISAAVSDRVVGVGERDDARGERDLFAAEPARITMSIPSLVMGEDSLGECGIEWRERLEDLSAEARMLGDFAARGVAEPGLFVDDVEECFVNLADVVEERDAFDVAALMRVEARGVGEDQRVLGDAAYVRAGFGIVRVDGVEQGLESRGGESLRGRTSAAFQDVQRARADAGGESDGRAHDWVISKRQARTDVESIRACRRGAGGGLLSRALSGGVPLAL